MSQATQGLALTVLIIGMMLIGFAMLIFALPELFAYLAAGVFFFIGLSVVGYSIRLFMTASYLKRSADHAAENDDGEGFSAGRKYIHVDVEE
jgi:hypothetical protein